MNILIDSLRISGFRGIKNLEVSLPRITVLIGPNNSGKTSLIQALQLSLGDYSRYLTEEDFYIDSNEKRAEKIIVDIRIVPTDEQGNRAGAFKNKWVNEFGDKIKAEANGDQFVVIRTRSERNITKGGFDTHRSTLETWTSFEKWRTEKIKNTKFSGRLQGMPLISMEAQRDIHQDLRNRSSFIGKILASVEYDENDILELERLIKDVNDEAVGKSNELKGLKFHLGKLNHSIGGSGGAEITPFPKKIRDLAKNFSVYFGETAANSFSMEYHGMGTRSWASILTIKAFIENLSDKHADESEPFFPILTAEEPEAHLHPNAQKTLFHQLADSKGQLILSTHSPFLAAMADFYQIRSLVKTQNNIIAYQISNEMKEGEKKAVRRNVLAKNGELLFAKCALLCEGMTEEQVIPAMIEIYFNEFSKESSKKSSWDLGVSCVNVGGKFNYEMFMKLVCNLGIPTSIISDNDGTTQSDLEKQIDCIQKNYSPLTESNFHISYHSQENDFEAELLAHGLRDEIIDALALYEIDQFKNAHSTQDIEQIYIKLNALNNDLLAKKMRKLKTQGAGFLVDILLENKRNKSVAELIPPNIRASFDCIKGWLLC